MSDAETEAWNRAGDLLLDSPLDGEAWILAREELAISLLSTQQEKHMYGNLCNYRDNEIIRPATADEWFDSLHATLDDGGCGVIEVDDGVCYVDGPGVRCVSDSYDAQGGIYDSPQDFYMMCLACFDEGPELVLHEDGWHDDDGLVLVRA
jgi:hypothetical protein